MLTIYYYIIPLHFCQDCLLLREGVLTELSFSLVYSYRYGTKFISDIIIRNKTPSYSRRKSRQEGAKLCPAEKENVMPKTGITLNNYWF